MADSHPPARLSVRLLGAVEVVLDGQRLRAFNSPRLQRFLALIALRDGPQHRSQLAFELWPDSDEGQARTNLRKLIHDFRHALPDADRFAEIDNEIVQWNRDGPSTVDVLAFEAARTSGDLELAASLYTGDLLPAGYDDWVLDERSRLRAEAHAALTSLMDDAAERGDHEAVIEFSRRALELEPADEHAVRAQMETHVALDKRAAALRAYHRYAEVLERELAVPPGASIRALYRALRTEPHDESVAADSPTATDPPFVGREPESNRLDETWRLVCGGLPHFALISGEPGIGKTRLAQELARRVRAEGHGVAAARAYEAAGRLPWGPVVDLLRSDAISSQLGTLDPAWREELARLLPELVEERHTSASTQSGDPAQRHRLFDAVVRAFTARGRPLLLIIDDLQWCDAETIELIGFLVRSARDAPTLVVGTARREEIGEDHPVTRLVQALERDAAVTRIALERLDEATTARLAARLHAENSIDAALAARLWSETEGIPLFVIEALRAGISSDTPQSLLTPTMRAVLRARLDQLGDDARTVAETAAVIGRPFSSELVAATSGIDENELADRIDELWRRRIVRDLGLRYDFSHDKLREVALETVSPARRRRLHRAIAEALATGVDGAAASPQVAAHYDQAGMVEPAIRAYREAGARAVAVSALDEAITMFRRALALLADLPPSADRDALEVEIRIALGSPLVALAGYGSRSSHQLYERAISLCRKLGRSVDPPILRGLGLARLQGCRFDDCSEMGRALLDREIDDPVAGTEGRYLLGVSAFWSGDLETARDYLQGAIDSYDASRRGEHLALYAQDPKAVCLVRLAWAELWAGDPEQADATARKALELAADLEHLMTLAYVITYAAIVAAEAEDFERLEKLLDDSDGVWQRLTERYLVVVLDALRGWLEVRGGSAGGIEKIERAVARSRAEGETLHLTYTLLLLARAHAAAGNRDAGRAAIREALAWTEARNQRYLEAELRRADSELD
ncbi:MAG TPA: AAA family ATPase [Gammaproteobacteria bacterium]